MSFDDFPDIKRIWDSYIDGTRAGIVSGYIKVRKMEIEAGRAKRGAEAAIGQLEARRRVIDEAVRSMRHQVDAERTARQIADERRRMLAGEPDAPQALPTVPAQRLLGSGGPPLVTHVSDEQARKEAVRIAAAYPGSGNPGERAFWDRQFQRLEADGYPTDAIDRIIRQATEKILEKERNP